MKERKSVAWEMGDNREVDQVGEVGRKLPRWRVEEKKKQPRRKRRMAVRDLSQE